jgi:hypothetical protein
MATMAELNKFFYAIQHDPDKPKPFLVRFRRPGASVLDYQPEETTKDICGRGVTLRKAAEEALKKKKAPPIDLYRAYRQLERMLPGIVEPTPFPRD